MIIAALYDIHGNLSALQAVLHELVQIKPDLVVIGGDVLPGPFPRACLDAIKKFPYPTKYIKGNGEDGVIDANENKIDPGLPESVQHSLNWNAQKMENEQIQEISSWPKTFSLSHPILGQILFCHATPENNTEIFTKKTSADLLPNSLYSFKDTIIICGHTHMQFDIIRKGVRIINAGSIGMPFGKSGAFWLLIKENITVMDTPYDLEDASQKVITSGYPEAHQFSEMIIRPPSESDMLERFSQL